MVADSVEYLTACGREVFFDAEHFFDGYKRNPEFSLRVLEAAAQRARRASSSATPTAGRCPHQVEQIVREVVDYFGNDVGVAVHLHDDAGTGVANALAGVLGGAMQVQGTINGYGERTGNCNLTTIIPNLTLKMGIETIPADRLDRLTPVAHHVAELVNMALNPQAAYVGESAFAHKAGLHVERDRQAARRVRARAAGVGRQRHPVPRLGARRQVDDPAQGQGARHRARRTAGQRRRRHPEDDGARGLPLRGGRRVARAAHAPGHRMDPALVHGRVVPGDHRRLRR